MVILCWQIIHAGSALVGYYENTKALDPCEEAKRYGLELNIASQLKDKYQLNDPECMILTIGK